MKAYAVAIWLQQDIGHRPTVQLGEFSDAEIAAWEAESRLRRRLAWVASIHEWIDRLTILAQAPGRQGG